MLILTVKKTEKVFVGPNGEFVELHSVRGHTVKLTFHFDEDTVILRESVRDKMLANKELRS